MKKQEIKTLTLNKKVVSKFDASKVKGGWITGKTGCIDQCEIK
ncbi:hypothetical protein U8527_15760 [Kordia algicida OT-1]|uniref:Uncharacterized protein n=1 Tax=Kordia algicida OT-1 TaxID=391587 RepID=A9E3V2_9FLAO|nr:hypothetical protein [Kordia algicida]EDP95274.1 hypothetical protein KAOT1_09386 [Kordia algicida OT-1]